MTARDIDALRDLAPGYVLDALTPDERAAFERALRDPATAALLEAEVHAMREIVGVVATGSAATPPPALRDRVLARIADEAKAAPPPAVVDIREFKRSETATRTPQRWMLPATLALAAAASVLVAVSLRSDLLRANNALSVAAAGLDSVRQQLAQRDATIRTLTDAGNDLLLVRLTPNTNAGPSLQVYWNVKRATAVIMASGLKQLATDRAYVLWMIRDGKPEAVALFRPDSSGAQVVPDITVPASVQGVSVFAVTEEAATGASAPTMTPFLVGSIGTK